MEKYIIPQVAVSKQAHKMLLEGLLYFEHVRNRFINEVCEVSAIAASCNIEDVQYSTTTYIGLHVWATS